MVFIHHPPYTNSLDSILWLITDITRYLFRNICRVYQLLYHDVGLNSTFYSYTLVIVAIEFKIILNTYIVIKNKQDTVHGVLETQLKAFGANNLEY